MSSKESAEPPEFFVDRGLGRLTTERLAAQGWKLHLIADEYDADADAIPDEDWIAEGCRRGWILLTKDKRIRYRAHELESLESGSFLFCLARGDWKVDAMVSAFTAARARILRAIERGDAGFWHIYADGTIKRMWP